MYSKVKKVFIGTDIARTASLVSIYNSTYVPAAGEILILDKDKSILAAGKTYNDTPVIYIAEGMSDTYSYVNDAGTTVTGVRRFIFSSPIDGARVIAYSGTAYTAKAEKSVTLGYINQTITVGDEYILRIVYKDVKEHPGQKTQTYRWTVTSATNASDTLWAKFAALVNADANARVTLTKNEVGSNTDTLTIAGKAQPECTTALTDIDEFRMVDFEVFFYYLDRSTSYKGLTPPKSVTLSAAATITGPTYGNGHWAIVRDAEKAVLGQQFGVTNRIWFPVRQPSYRTVLNETYDTITIEHNVQIKAADGGFKSVPHETQIFIPNTATSNQMDSILAVLNPWMQSVSGSFSNVTF